LDNVFNPGVSNGVYNAGVYNVVVQADGRILVGGAFTTLGGQPRNCLGRLTGGGAAIQTLALDAAGSSVTWSRSGVGPEIQQVTFEQSTDGTNYSLLRDGTRSTGAWQLSGVTSPFGQNFYIRARGRNFGGEYNGCSGLIESVRQFYLPARLTGIASLTGGSIALGGKGAVGDAYVLLAASNFLPPVVWMPIATNIADANGVVSFSDLMATNNPQRFYLIKPLLP
jgi:hypothetical protein